MTRGTKGETMNTQEQFARFLFNGPAFQNLGSVYRDILAKRLTEFFYAYGAAQTDGWLTRRRLRNHYAAMLENVVPARMLDQAYRQYQTFCTLSEEEQEELINSNQQ